jgi:hypothetical protein
MICSSVNFECFMAKAPCHGVILPEISTFVWTIFREEVNCAELPNGLYLFVIQGDFVVGNAAVSKTGSTCRYADVPDTVSMPQILPGNPGLDFSLPPIVTYGTGQDSYVRIEPGREVCDCMAHWRRWYIAVCARDVLNERCRQKKFSLPERKGQEGFSNEKTMCASKL